MSDALNRAVEICDLWAAPTDGTKLARWREIMGVDAPFNPDLVISTLAGWLKEARVEMDEIVGENALLQDQIESSRWRDLSDDARARGRSTTRSIPTPVSGRGI